MPGLLAAHGKPAPDHLFHHVLVADRASHEVDPRVAQRDLEPDIAHDGGDERVALEPPLRFHVAGANQHHRIAVDDATFVIHEDGAVTIAVEGNTHAMAVLAHQCTQALGMRGPDVQIDVAPVRLVADDRNLEAELAEQPRGNGGRGAVGRIDGEAEPLPLTARVALDQAARIRKRQPGVRDVGVRDIRAIHRGQPAGGHLPARISDDRFHLLLELVRELLAAA